MACGGFSYGDVLGAGGGWAKSILFNERARDQFAGFFGRDDSFALGVCNGCQMLSQLRELIPGAEDWPRFVRNESEQFEARVSMVRVEQSASILLAGMEGSRLPIAVAHGEGRAEFRDSAHLRRMQGSAQVALRYLDNHGQVTTRYPANPNGSPGGITGLTTPDGRVTIMMPHPERVARAVTNSWRPAEWTRMAPGCACSATPGAGWLKTGGASVRAAMQDADARLGVGVLPCLGSCRLDLARGQEALLSGTSSLCFRCDSTSSSRLRNCA